MFGLGLDARLGGAPGRAGTAMSSCWAGKEAKHGAIGPLLSLRYITPDHAIIKMLEREQKKRAAEKRREEERAAGAQVKIFELTPDGRRLLVNAPSGAGRASPTLRSSSSTGQLLGLPAVEVPSGRRLELPPPRGRSRPASRSCCVSSSSVASFHSSASLASCSSVVKWTSKPARIDGHATKSCTVIRMCRIWRCKEGSSCRSCS